MIPGGYAAMRIGAGFSSWEYAYACALSASIETGRRYRVYRGLVGFGMGWRVRPAVTR